MGRADNQKILVADDDIMILRMISGSLEKQGYDVVTTDDGQDTLDKALNEDFDLIITDIMMPGMEGIEVISELLDTKPDSKIIAISGQGKAGYTTFLSLAETVGAQHSLKKPFSSKELLETVHSII